MKKLLVILIILSIYVFAGCGESGSDYPRGYRKIFTGKPSKPSASKQFKFSNFFPGLCGPLKDCNAIINISESNGQYFVGIAASHTSPPFKLKIYWPANEIPTGSNITLSNCTIELTTGTYPYTYEKAISQNINVDITPPALPPADQIYAIKFLADVSVQTHKISANDTITAQKYP